VVDAPLLTIPGQPPNPRSLPPGCAFHPRCGFAQEICRRERPPLVERGPARLACHFPVSAPLPAVPLAASAGKAAAPELAP
jgi:ABC-type dipeptide/oligopeptide/nickel transport system ATPase component